MLEVKNLCKQYKTNKVLESLSIKIETNDFVGLVGPNGVGKSTLIGCICGIVRHDSGEIFLDGSSIAKNPCITKCKIGTCFQESIIDRFFNVFDTVRFNAMYHGLNRQEAIHQTNNILRKLKLFDKRHLFGEELSGGMKKRFQIAQTLVHDPDLVIFDEPSAGADLELKEDLHRILRDIHLDKNKTIILTSHYLEEICSLTTRILMLNNGQVVKDIKKEVDSSFDDGTVRSLYKEMYFRA